MKRIFSFLYQNLKWVFLGIGYAFLCWATYQDSKLPWYYIILACLLGLAIGLTMIIKIIDPFLKYYDAKIISWLGGKKSRE